MVDLRKLDDHHLRRLASDYPESASYPGALEQKILIIWNYLNERPPSTIEEYARGLRDSAKKELERRLEEERRRRAELEAKEAKRRAALVKKLQRWLVGIEEPVSVVEETGHLEWRCPVCGNKARFDLKDYIDDIAKGKSALVSWYCAGKNVVDGPNHWGLTREIRLVQGEEISRKILEGRGRQRT
ncbi:hypothetical protein KEJ39_01295 [Candidatus Bathyarchaeota archaeon]|nr:hypothetical protein [Candidatus Bathyarchaeota archaeon]